MKRLHEEGEGYGVSTPETTMGMGPVTWPTDEHPGSGDVPCRPRKKKKIAEQIPPGTIALPDELDTNTRGVSESNHTYSMESLQSYTRRMLSEASVKWNVKMETGAKLPMPGDFQKKMQIIPVVKRIDVLEVSGSIDFPNQDFKLVFLYNDMQEYVMLVDERDNIVIQKTLGTKAVKRVDAGEANAIWKAVDQHSYATLMVACKAAIEKIFYQ